MALHCRVILGNLLGVRPLREGVHSMKRNIRSEREELHILDSSIRKDSPKII